MKPLSPARQPPHPAGVPAGSAELSMRDPHAPRLTGRARRTQHEGGVGRRRGRHRGEPTSITSPIQVEETRRPARARFELEHFNPQLARRRSRRHGAALGHGDGTGAQAAQDPAGFVERQPDGKGRRDGHSGDRQKGCDGRCLVRKRQRNPVFSTKAPPSQQAGHPLDVTCQLAVGERRLARGPQGLGMRPLARVLLQKPNEGVPVHPRFSLRGRRAAVQRPRG